jgi:hypothetical protein
VPAPVGALLACAVHLLQARVCTGTTSYFMHISALLNQKATTSHDTTAFTATRAHIVARAVSIYVIPVHVHHTSASCTAGHQDCSGLLGHRSFYSTYIGTQASWAPQVQVICPRPSLWRNTGGMQRWSLASLLPICKKALLFRRLYPSFTLGRAYMHI